jgi:hypothetical protein
MSADRTSEAVIGGYQAGIEAFGKCHICRVIGAEIVAEFQDSLQ